MNNDRRKRISAISEQLDKLKETIEALRDEEQESLDNLPEPLQGGERGDKMEAAIEALDYAIDDLQECIDYLSDAVE